MLDARQRAQRYLDDNAALPLGVDLITDPKRLDDVVTSLSAHALDQDVDDRGANSDAASSISSVSSFTSSRWNPSRPLHHGICEVCRNSGPYRCRTGDGDAHDRRALRAYADRADPDNRLHGRAGD
jgi:hypothetical protein